MGLFDKFRSSGGSGNYAADFKKAYEQSDVRKMKSIVNSWNDKNDEKYLIARALLAKIDDPSNFERYLNELVRHTNNKNKYSIQPLDGSELGNWYTEKSIQLTISFLGSEFKAH